MNIANSKCERTKPRTTPEKCGWYIRLLNVFKFALLFSPHPLNLHHISEFYMGMSKNFEYLSVSKGHLKASLGSTQNSTFVARVGRAVCRREPSRGVAKSSFDPRLNSIQLSTGRDSAQR